MMQRARAVGVQVMMLTVDGITGGNRERDIRTGFSIPFHLTIPGMLQFAMKPRWMLDHATHARFSLPQLENHVDIDAGTKSIGRYFTEMLDPSMNWDDVAEMVKIWGGHFCLKEIMSSDDAKRAIDFGYYPFKPWWPTTRRSARAFRSACGSRRYRGQSARRYDGWRNSARDSRPESTFDRSYELKRSASVDTICTHLQRWPAWC